jgi:DNA-binding beta-propeller fold protein YncE
MLTPNDSDGTPIVVDRKDAFAITGTVSVVDLAKGTTVKTFNVGLHPAGMTISGSNLYVAAYRDSFPSSISTPARSSAPSISPNN